MERRLGRLLWLAALAAVLGWWPGARPVAAQGPDSAVTVAVMPFEVRVRGPWWWAGYFDLGPQITALVTDRLVNRGHFRVVERSRIDTLLHEQELSASARVDPASAVEIGRLLGARLLVFGTVTQYTLAEAGRLSVGPVSVRGTTAEVALTGRVVDAETGLILGSVRGKGRDTGAAVSVRALEGISFQAARFQETTLGRATLLAADGFADELAAVIGRSALDRAGPTQRLPVRGSVVELIPGGVIINAGKNHGVAERQRFRVFRTVPVQGVPEPVRVPVGTVRVISVDPHASVALFEETTSEVRVGDWAEAVP